jgi:hypothetical protein
MAAPAAFRGSYFHRLHIDLLRVTSAQCRA